MDTAIVIIVAFGIAFFLMHIIEKWEDDLKKREEEKGMAIGLKVERALYSTAALIVGIPYVVLFALALLAAIYLFVQVLGSLLGAL